MGSQAHVEMKDAFLFRFNPLQQFLGEAFEVFAVLYTMPPTCAPCASIDKEYLDIGGVAQFAAAELAHPQNGKGAGFLIRQMGSAILFNQLGLAVFQTP